jgi:hypothetical protein
MTVETQTFVRVAEGLAETVRRLRRESAEALRRSAKRDPGDRAEVRRAEAADRAIERCALASLWAGEMHLDGAEGLAAADIWRSYGAEVVELRLPHGSGETVQTGVPGTGPPPPLPVWRSRSRGSRAAMRERFRQQVAAALAGESGEAAMLRPSGITNSVLTETLREFVERGDQKPVFIPVRYRDGSFGPDFPLRSAALAAVAPSGWRRLRFTLLSIRHVEMDALVDGAWLRNTKVSQPRPAGQTDALVYDSSLRQLRTLTADGPVLLEMYQTGLDTAVVGFYRAVTRHLIERPGTLAVRPFYYSDSGGFEEGSLWASA